MDLISLLEAHAIRRMVLRLLVRDLPLHRPSLAPRDEELVVAIDGPELRRRKLGFKLRPTAPTRTIDVDVTLLAWHLRDECRCSGPDLAILAFLFAFADVADEWIAGIDAFFLGEWHVSAAPSGGA